MRVEVLAGAAAVAARSAETVCTLVARVPAALIGVPTGATPIATYVEIARRGASGQCDLSGARLYAVDEFVEPRGAVAGTNRAYYQEQVRFTDVRCPDPATIDANAEIGAFATQIADAGGLDLCLLGIGVNGHVAFNEPGSGADSGARVVELTAQSRAAHAAAFGSLDAVPRRGMTLGVADILESKLIVVLATGTAKADIVARAIRGEPNAEVPASWLKRHRDVTWLLDGDAASGLKASR